jgi:hypothetical protein
MGWPISERRLWTLVGAASAALAGFAVRQAAHKGWRYWRDEDPPNNPADPGVAWRDALVWAGSVSALVAVARVVARRGAAAGWSRARGRRPPL